MVRCNAGDCWGGSMCTVPGVVVVGAAQCWDYNYGGVRIDMAEVTMWAESW